MFNRDDDVLMTESSLLFVLLVVPLKVIFTVNIRNCGLLTQYSVSQKQRIHLLDQFEEKMKLKCINDVLRV